MEEKFEESVEEKLKKKIEISMLCEYYGSLLTTKQYTFLNDYYNNDLSLSEIADNNQITRKSRKRYNKEGREKAF